MEQKIVEGVNNAVKKGGTDTNYMSTIRKSFPDSKRTPSYGGVLGLFEELKGVSNNSAIIVGYFRKAHMPKDYNAHAFNAVKNKDGSWKFLDAQNGKQYSQDELNEAFGRFDVVDTNPVKMP